MSNTRRDTTTRDEAQSQNQTPPNTREVAVALQVQPDRLAEFAECHPDPSVSAVLALSERPPADENTREMVARWVEAADTDAVPIEEKPGGEPAGLPRGGRR